MTSWWYGAKAAVVVAGWLPIHSTPKVTIYLPCSLCDTNLCVEFTPYTAMCQVRGDEYTCGEGEREKRLREREMGGWKREG